MGNPSSFRRLSRRHGGLLVWDLEPRTILSYLYPAAVKSWLVKGHHIAAYRGTGAHFLGS